MENQQTVATWQVDVGGQIYVASFDELGDWIGEGSLLPQDKVRKGNLRWIEAQKVPGLVPFFNAKANGEPMPVSITETPAESLHGSEKVASEELVGGVASEVSPIVLEAEAVSPAPIDSKHCSLHPELESTYVCDTCCNGFCKTCPKSYGGSVRICPMCGAMCTPVDEARAAAQKFAAVSTAVEEGFGFGDFVSALAHPLKFKVSLFFGALLFAFFTVSQSASGMGGMLMFSASIICLMLGNTLTFGVLANTIDKFVQGDLESNFMPEYEDFNAMEDVLHPYFLSIAAYLVSFGPFFITLLIGLYLVTSSNSAQMQTFQSEIEKIPGTHYYAGREPVEQSKQVDQVLGKISDNHQEILNQHNEAATGNLNGPTATPIDEDLEIVNQMQESRKRELEAAFGKTAETRSEELDGMARSILSLAAPLFIICIITFLWGAFFYPIACAVAGYTRSFSSTINPSVGLDTIKRMGSDYFKILLMGFSLVVVSLITSAILGLIFAPFDLPGMGNIPAKVLSSFLTFYLFAVFSCVMGYALYKNAHKLGLPR